MVKTTTSHFQKKPDFFQSKEDCVKNEKERVNTNPKYKFFNQTHFTAGDEEQFQHFRDPTNGRVCIGEIDLSENVYRKKDMSDKIDWEKYRDINAVSVDNTFRYIFYKFKKGIFIKVKEGKMHVFLPFSNKNFVNEWSKLIKVDPKYRDISGFIRYIYQLEGRPTFNSKYINNFTDTWYANNCLLRYEFPIHEGDSNSTNMSDMFNTLCEERKIPDMEFFVNRRDFPLIKRDETEAYTHIFGQNQPLLSHNHDKYSPILSMVTGKNFADIPIPTGDDWARVCRKEGKFFSRSCNRDFIIDPVPWNKKKSIAVFRGGSTGCGTDVKTNIRLKLAYMSSKKPKDDKGELLLDAGITNWNLRPRKLRNKEYLQTIDIKNIGFGLVDRLTPQEQAEYKYVINVDGHVSAYRLSLELSSGFCVLLAPSKYKLWYHSFLKPFKHFVPLKSDLSDLLEKIKWCKENDEKCQEIAKNAEKFSKKYLSKEGILDYLQKLLYDLKKVNGVYMYNVKKPINIQDRTEEKILENRFYPKIEKSIESIEKIPSQRRCFGLLQGVEWLVSKLLTESSLDKWTETQVLFEDKDNLFTEINIGNYPVIRKRMNRYIVHEAFIGMKGINPLLKQIPNFVYTFGAFENNLLTERIQGETLDYYIHSDNFVFEDFCILLLQVCLALHVAQRNCCFVHNDLTPGNIVIQYLPEPMDFNYIIDYKTVYTVKTQMIPLIENFEHSHIVYNDQHFGTKNMFSCNIFEDVSTLLSSCFYKMLKKTKYNSEILRLFKVVRLFRNIEEIKFFLRKSKRIEVTPLVLAKYLMNMYKFSVKISDRFHNRMNIGNAMQVFQYAFAENDIERINTFLDVFRRVKNCDIPETENILLSYYVIQSLYDNLSSVYDIFQVYLGKIGKDPDEYEKKYKKIIKFVTRIKKGEKKKIDYSLQKSLKISFSQDTFLEPRKALKIYESIKDFQVEKELDMRVIEQVLLSENEPLPEDVKNFYIENFKDVFRVEYRTDIPDIVTFRKLIKEVFAADYEYLKENGEDCSILSLYELK